MERRRAFLNKIVLLVALLPATPLFAQFDFPTLGGRGAAMGGVGVALDDEVSAMYGVAALASKEQASVALAARQSYLAEGMGYALLGGIVPVGFGSTALSVTHYGNADYNEQQASLSYAVPLGQNVSLGAAFHYLHSGTSDPYYDPLNKITFSLALRYEAGKNLAVAFKAFNPTAVVANEANSQHIPSLFTLGVAYRLIDELLAVGEVEKNLYQSATLRFGLEYELEEIYYFRLGMSTFPAIYTLGFGLDKKHFCADIAVQIHNVLGVTPNLSIVYIF